MRISLKVQYKGEKARQFNIRKNSEQSTLEPSVVNTPYLQNDLDNFRFPDPDAVVPIWASAVVFCHWYTDTHSDLYVKIRAGFNNAMDKSSLEKSSISFMQLSTGTKTLTTKWKPSSGQGPGASSHHHQPSSRYREEPPSSGGGKALRKYTSINLARRSASPITRPRSPYIPRVRSTAYISTYAQPPPSIKAESVEMTTVPDSPPKEQPPPTLQLSETALQAVQQLSQSSAVLSLLQKVRVESTGATPPPQGQAALAVPASPLSNSSSRQMEPPASSHSQVSPPPASSSFPPPRSPPVSPPSSTSSTRSYPAYLTDPPKHPSSAQAAPLTLSMSSRAPPSSISTALSSRPAAPQPTLSFTTAFARTNVSVRPSGSPAATPSSAAPPQQPRAIHPDSHAVTRELWDVRRQLTALRAREGSLALKLKQLGAPSVPDAPIVASREIPEERQALEDALTAVRAQLREESAARRATESALQEERRRRLHAEGVLDDARRECTAPFVVPSLMDAFKQLAQLTGEALMGAELPYGNEITTTTGTGW